MRRLPDLLIFLAGLAIAGWIGAGYATSSALGLVFTVLIAGCYVYGALELRRYHRATVGLDTAVAALDAPPATLEGWLAGLAPSLRNAVRLRVQGERAALPAPALSPYLSGLLVLLGMLGTLLGMMVTLRGTGLALETGTDLQAMRAALAAPVKGLGFAFGTSIAGVSTSAALGLLSALARRERAHASQQLDAAIGSHLRGFSLNWQREETFRLLQQQAGLMPALAQRLDTLASQVERHSADAGARQQASQDAFNTRTEAAYTQLAERVGHSLRDSAAEGARSAGAVLQPVVASTLAALAGESERLQAQVAQGVQHQLDALSSGFAALTQQASGGWTRALDGQREANTALLAELRSTLDGLSSAIDTRTGQLLDGAGIQLERGVAAFDDRASQLLEGVGTRLEATAGTLGQAWQQALAQQQDTASALTTRHDQSLAGAVARIEQQASTLLDQTAQAHAGLHERLAAQEDQRTQAWSTALATLRSGLQEDWQQAGAQTAARQQQICDALERTAQAIAEQGREHAGQTIAEIARLTANASDAPRAAAEAIAEVRQKLSDSVARDADLLEERARHMELLGQLLTSVNGAASEQRTAVEQLVSTSSGLLQQVGERFAAQAQDHTARIDAAAAQVTASATEVASLGDAFGAAVDRFGQANAQLGERLAQIEQALDKAATRNDEQLAYYVAQAREVIDLSLLSQKQIIADLHQARGHEAAAGTGTGHA